MLYIVQMVPVLYFSSLDSLAYCFGFNVLSIPPSAFNPTVVFFSFQIWLLCQIRGVGFVLKKLFTHFEMLIVSHALHCVNGHYLYSVSFDSLVNCFGLSVT